VPEQLLSDEETRAAFADLRATALADVKAPGPGVARRALRRRRALTSAAAGVAVVAVAGGVAAVAWSAGGSPAPTPGVADAASTPARPSLPVPAGAEGGRLSAIARDSLDEPYTMKTTTVGTGVYRYVVVCSGKGTGTATLTTGGKTATGTVTCATPPATSTVELDVTEAGADLTLRIDWAPGHELRDTADGWAIGVWTTQLD
jgi:hypothetical protein